MKLFLASEAKDPESIKKLKKFIGSFKDKTIAYIPTAANGEFYGSWKGDKSIQVAMKLGVNIKIIELEDYIYRDIVEEIKKCDIVWMAGGMSGYLLYWIRRVKLDKKLKNFLDKGMIYVGSSAGSMICAKTQQSAEWFIGEEEPGASLMPGLGLIDFEIYPHYEDHLLPKIKKKWKKGKLYLLKNGEVIIYENGLVKVLGKERIIEK